MKDFHLRFFEARWFDGFIDLLEDDEEEIPEASGAYVLGTSDGTKLVYPWGMSPVFYIGKASNLRKRLADHKKFTNQAIRDHEELRFWPRYQYGAAYGIKLAWFTCRGKQRPGNLEASLIDDFYSRYGAIPSANGAWPKGVKKPTKGEQYDR